MTEAEEKASSATPGDESATVGAPQVPIADIEQKGNVREVDLSSVKELADSIRQVGVLEPVLLVRTPEGEKGGRRFALVAGFRRVAAARLAGLKTVPAVIQDLTPERVSEVRLIENLQREDLTPIEEARALKAYLELTKTTQEELGKRIGKSQPYVANRVRLLELPDPVRSALEAGKLSPSHGEIFLQLPKEATPTEVDNLLSHQLRNDESTATLRRNVQWKAGTIRDRVKRKKVRAAAIESSKFPVCPVKGCGGKGQPDVDWKGKVGPTLSDTKGHTWSRKNGELIKSRPRRSEPAAAREPPKPRLPVVPEDVPFEATLDQLWEAIIGTPAPGGAVGISRFSVHPDRKGEIELQFSARVKKSLPGGVGSFGLSRKGPGFVQLWNAAEWSQDTDRDRLRLHREYEALEAWGKKLAGAKPAPPAKASASRVPAAKKTVGRRR